jgi:hypothetical protein
VADVEVAVGVGQGGGDEELARHGVDQREGKTAILGGQLGMGAIHVLDQLDALH